MSTMAPTAVTVEWQTNEIIKCLLEDEDEHDNECRVLDCSEIEVDSPEANENFDPVQIADKLKRVADALNEDVKFKAALTELKSAAAQEALDAAFSHGVEALCQTRVCQGAEVASEMQLIRASVAFGLYVKKSCPELKHKVQRAMASFLNNRVGSWVTQQGGWNNVAGICD